MFKKPATFIIAGLILTSSALTVAHAATISNGVACAKSGASLSVKAKGVSKTYICTVNPAAASNPNIAKDGKTWTLKTCVTYYAQYRSAYDSLKNQRDVINLLQEPDKTTAMKGYTDGMISLTKTLAAIENNHCKKGL